jgi:hypothetical protein
VQQRLNKRTPFDRPVFGNNERISAIVLCGGMGKRMRPETRGRISKGELPILLPGWGRWSETNETALGMLVRALVLATTVQQILLLTSDRWSLVHSELARVLTQRYEINVRCETDSSSGDEFPPQALQTLIQKIDRNTRAGAATLLMNGDLLLPPHNLKSFGAGIQYGQPLIAAGCATGIEYLGLYFISSGLNWSQLVREIAPGTLSELIGGVWQRVPILPIKLDGPIYDCGSVEGYRMAYKDGRDGRLW